MNTLDFALATSINKKLITIDEKATTAQQNAMFNDEYYGLSDIDNYGKYDQLMAYQSPLKRRLFKNELKTYFGLSQAQVDSIEANWNSIYT
jgi:hypothetical protein